MKEKINSRGVIKQHYRTVKLKIKRIQIRIKILMIITSTIYTNLYNHFKQTIQNICVRTCI